MKLIIPSACLVTGIAIGWVAHPLAQSSTAPAANPVAKVSDTPARPGSSSLPAADDHSPSRASDRGGKKAGDSATTKGDEMSAEQKEAFKKARGDMSKRMTDMQRKKFETRLAKLAVELHLTPEQLQAVRDSEEKHLAVLGSMFDGDLSGDPSSDKIKEKLDLIKGDAIDETLSTTLQGDQLAEYQDVKAKELKTRSEAKALKDLSNLSSVIDDLTQEQRDTIYQTFTERAASAPPPGPMSQLYDGMGVQMDDELGMQDMMEQHMSNFGDPDQAGSIQDTMKAALDQKIESRLADLKGNLSDAQLQQYRAHLEEKESGILNMFGGGSGGSDSSTHSHDTYYVVPKK